MLIFINNEFRDVELVSRNNDQIMVKDTKTLRSLFIHRTHYERAQAEVLKEQNSNQLKLNL